MSKQSEYESLVKDRKSCSACTGLINPSEYRSGAFDSPHVGPWSRWQGDINSSLMVVGQDWGDAKYFEINQGHDAKGNPTNNTLRKLLKSVGVEVSSPERIDQTQVAFFTNAILCLKKDGGLQGAVRTEWFKNCSVFLRRQVEMVAPRVVVTLGEKALRALAGAFEIPIGRFRAEVENQNEISLPNGSLLVPVYHCGARILNTHRPLEQQFKDWQRVSHALENHRSNR